MSQNLAITKRKGGFGRALKKEWPLHLFLIPGLVLLIWFYYYPMIGNVMAFQKFTVFKGWFHHKVKWVGWDNFEFVMSLPNFFPVLWNTLYISTLKIIFNLLVPIVVSLMLNELRLNKLKRTVQTVIYMPHFLSWIVFGGIILDVLGTDGVVNQLINLCGGDTVHFLTNDDTFPGVLVVTDVWKNFGFNTIVYMSALTAIDPTLYEAAAIDGAGRWKQTVHVTIPGIMPTIVLLTTLSLGSVLNAGFDQVYMLLNDLVKDSGDILDTLVYRLAFDNAQYSIATAVGLFKSVISMILICSSYYMAYRFADYRIF